MGGACSMYGEIRNAFKILVGKTEGKTLLKRPKRRWEDNIKIYLRNRVGVCALDSSGSG
jgi:hypothetical protein